MVGRGLAGQHEDTSADHRTYAKQDEVFSREGPFQRGFAIQAAFDGFAGIDVPGRFNRLDLNRAFSMQYFLVIGLWAADTLPATLEW